MGWELPVSILDLYAEMCLRLNGRKDEKGRRYHPSLLMALEYHGLEAISAAEKTSMRNLILSGSYTAEDQKSILAYCWEDVTALERLLPAILPSIDVQQALWRGSYTRVCAAVEYYGIPVDAPVYADLKEKWSAIRAGLALAAEDKYGFGVFVSDSKGRVTWSEKGFETLVCRLGLDQMWPRTPTGKFSTSDPEKGADDDKVDVFLGPHPLSEIVYALEDLGPSSALKKRFPGLGAEDFAFQLLERGGSEAFRADQRLLAFVIGGCEMEIGFGNLHVIAEDGIEADFERIDAGALALALFHCRDDLLGVLAEVAEFIEVRVEAAANDAGIGGKGGRFFGKSAFESFADVGEFVDFRGHEPRLEPQTQGHRIGPVRHDLSNGARHTPLHAGISDRCDRREFRGRLMRGHNQTRPDGLTKNLGRHFRTHAAVDGDQFLGVGARARREQQDDKGPGHR
jgi:hypothetical protein